MSITTEVHGSTVLLRCAAGDNRLSAAVLDAWDDALDRVESDDAIGALELIGDGRFYSYGLDVDVDVGVLAAAVTEAELLDTALAIAARRGNKQRSALGAINADLYASVSAQR